MMLILLACAYVIGNREEETMKTPEDHIIEKLDEIRHRVENDGIKHHVLLPIHGILENLLALIEELNRENN